ncbi:single-stranded DNA-binding protein [Rubripirellula reticaptiva]|uniref:Single-stranded DNA-binding protein n=1 Tax=Rubripirellula reticaptiva TaxID=2528013 RepID=A0A5C6F7G8_9BACT|nr:single-stranded DNA-binding protein [Rubripirellula reticaptiva]TWU55719.1 Single-stranded DNA-binding protein [Rubripirellula reticaptiva]
MASYNRVMLMGNLTREIELRYTPGGTAVMDNAIAVNDRRKSASGEWVEETTFVDITFWGRTAEVASEYLGKGSPIFVEGRLKLDSWETDGQKRSKLRVVCDRMQMIGGQVGNQPAGGQSSSGQSRPASTRQESTPRHDSENSARPAAQTQRVNEAPASQNPAPPSQQPMSAGRPSAQPTGDGDGYDEPDIPF